MVLTILVLTILLCMSACTPKPKPDFYTSHGTAVHTQNIPGITELKVWRALEFFAIAFPQYIKDVSEEEIRDILSKTTLTWEPGSFKCKRCPKTGCDGTQLGHKLRVRWTGYVQGCALFHELAHEVMEFTQGTIDYEHTWKDWYDAVRTLKHRYSKLGVE